jgi:hypothetical protein
MRHHLARAAEGYEKLAARHRFARPSVTAWCAGRGLADG